MEGCGYGVKCQFQQYFSYIVAFSFIGGGNLSTQKTIDLPQATEKTLSHNVSSTPHYEQDSNSQL